MKYHLKILPEAGTEHLTSCSIGHHTTNWATEPFWKLISISRSRPWTSIGRPLLYGFFFREPLWQCSLSRLSVVPKLRTWHDLFGEGVPTANCIERSGEDKMDKIFYFIKVLSTTVTRFQEFADIELASGVGASKAQIWRQAPSRQSRRWTGSTLSWRSRRCEPWRTTLSGKYRHVQSTDDVWSPTIKCEITFRLLMFCAH